MYLKSPYPPVPPVQDTNFHEHVFSSPLNSTAAPDYVLHIDGLSGRQRTRDEFYEELRDGATALAAPVANGGLGLRSENGDMVAIYSANCLTVLTLIHSCLVAGVPFALVSAYSTPFELAHALKTARPSVTFVHASLYSSAVDVAKQVGIPVQSIQILEGDIPGREDFLTLLRTLRQRGVQRVPVKPVTKDTLAYLVFSSGTSGLPKAVMISHGNLTYTKFAAMVRVQTEMKARPIPMPPPHMNWIIALPLHHSYGLHLFCLQLNYAFPTTLVILPKWDTVQVLAAIPRYRISVLPLVPSVAHQMVHSPKFATADFSTIQMVVCGGATLPVALGDRLSALTKGSPITEGYGLSEATVSACLKPAPGLFPGIEPVNGSCGVLLPGMEARILREDGSHAGVNEPGEFLLRGPNVALGYYNNAEATKETFVDGWLRTGDQVRADASGTIYFVDRIKDTLKVSGVQVSPTEIETVLRSHPSGYIADVSVAGVPGIRTADEKVPRAWIVLSQEGKTRGEFVVAQELDDWVKQNLSSYKWLRGGIEFISEIPKLPTGKTLRRVLQDGYAAAQKERTARPRL